MIERLASLICLCYFTVAKLRRFSHPHHRTFGAFRLPQTWYIAKCSLLPFPVAVLNVGALQLLLLDLMLTLVNNRRYSSIIMLIYVYILIFSVYLFGNFAVVVLPLQCIT